MIADRLSPCASFRTHSSRGRGFTLTTDFAHPDRRGNRRWSVGTAAPTGGLV